MESYDALHVWDALFLRLGLGPAAIRSTDWIHTWVKFRLKMHINAACDKVKRSSSRAQEQKYIDADLVTAAKASAAWKVPTVDKHSILK